MVSGGVGGPGSVVGLQVSRLEVLGSGCGAGMVHGVESVFELADRVREIVGSELSGGAHVVDMGGEKSHIVCVRDCDWELSVVCLGVWRDLGNGVAGCGGVGGDIVGV